MVLKTQTLPKGKTPRRGLRRFLNDRSGVAAVEFAFIAPVMILFYFGMTELCQAMMAQRRASHVASAVGDLAAQDDVLTNAEVNDIFKIADAIIAPFPKAGLKTCLTSVTQAATKATVDWSVSSGAACHAPGDTMALPKAPKAKPTDPDKPFIDTGQTVIVSEVKYSYTSPTSYIINAPISFSEIFYLRPRKSDKITRTA